MTTLGPSSDYTGAAVTQGGKKTFIAAMRALIADRLGVGYNLAPENVASASNVDLSAINTRQINLTGTTQVDTVTAPIGLSVVAKATGAVTLVAAVTGTGADITMAAGDSWTWRATAADTMEVIGLVRAALPIVSDGVRQTVLSGPVTTAGLPNFGGATGSTTVTATGTLIVTAANGYTSAGQLNRRGSITNPAWTGLSTNGTMYLYLDIAANGTCTTGSGTLAPNYRWGGADVTTSGQFTFNIQEMVGKVGNGSAAVQTYRVYVGEVTVAGNVVTAIVWYALMRRYVSADQALPAGGTPVTLQHNIGVNAPFCGKVMVYLRNNVGNLNYVADDLIPYASSVDNATLVQTPYISRLATGINGTYASIGIANKGTGARAGITDTNWRFVFVVTPEF